METVMNEFKMTYYVGVMLAQGGILKIKQDRVIFVPGTIERTVGASETEILFDKIKLVDVTGTITESLMIRTLEKAHRFVGGDVYKIRDQINSAMHIAHQQRTAEVIAQPTVPQPVPPTTSEPKPASATVSTPAADHPAQTQNDPKCPACSQAIRKEFNFCPYCQKALKKICTQCYQTVGLSWKFCAFCNQTL